MAFKFGLTAAGVVVLILLARVRAFGRLPVSALLYGVLAAYLWLVSYEFSLLRHAGARLLLARLGSIGRGVMRFIARPVTLNLSFAACLPTRVWSKQQPASRGTRGAAPACASPY